jgi:cytidylate kinase
MGETCARRGDEGRRVTVNRIVTISAAYGAGGSVVAPAVADALGFPFLDRAVHSKDGVPAAGVAEAAKDEERTGGLWTRVLEAFAWMPTDAPGNTMALVSTDQALRTDAENRLREFVAGSEGVILGWASVLVVDEAFHVRLDGPVDARVRQARSIDSRLDEAAARRQLDDTDRIRALYWRRLYRSDWGDLRRFHLVIDSTAIDLATVRDLITTGAQAFWRR